MTEADARNIPRGLYNLAGLCGTYTHSPVSLGHPSPDVGSTPQMSTPQAILHHAIHAAKQSQVNKCAAYSRLALLAYELLLNAPREKELIWEQKWRASTAIYFFLRYPVIAFQVFNVYASAYTTPHCDALYKFTWALSIITTRLAITASFVLRIYAIMGLSRTGLAAAVLLGLIGLSSIGLDIWQDVQLSCTTFSNPLSTVLTFFMLAAFDVLTTGILIFRTVALFKGSGWRTFRSHGLVSALMQQGVIYFFTVSAVQVIVIVLYYLPQGTYSLVLNNYSLLLSSVLLSRFLLDLRELHLHPNRTTISQDAVRTVTAIQFDTPPGSHPQRRVPGVVRDFVDPPSWGTMSETYDLGEEDDPSKTYVRSSEGRSAE